MPETDNGIRGSLDLEYIARTAELAAACLKSGGVARVDLTPGDMTCYRIVLIAPSIPTIVRAPDGAGVTLEPHGEGVVSVQPGDSYAWPKTWLHHDYCAAKWGRGDQWTGVVVAELLNSVHDILEAGGDA